MAIDDDVRPTDPGSPFPTKNFNKFTLGIMLAALVLVILILLYFVAGVGRHQPGPANADPHSAVRLQSPALG